MLVICHWHMVNHFLWGHVLSEWTHRDKTDMFESQTISAIFTFRMNLFIMSFYDYNAQKNLYFELHVN